MLAGDVAAAARADACRHDARAHGKHDASARLHRVARIDGEIHEHLFTKIAADAWSRICCT
jgi:hypothetical protein